MNGKTIPWSGLRSGGPGLGPARYVAVWRRFHRIGDAAGMSAARWVWCVDAWGMGPHVGWNQWPVYFPGETQIDWVGIDAYRWPHTPDHAMRDLIDGPLAGDFLSRVSAFAGGKPVMVGEIAASNSDPAAAPWLKTGFAALADHPAIGAICWFNKNQDGVDWALRRGTPVTAAYRQAIADKRFASRFAIAER